MNFKKWSLAAAVIWATLVNTNAQTGFKNQSVSVFKNGTAFFVKTGTVSTPDKYWLWQSDSLPQMLEGTFWVNSPTADLASVKSMLDDKKETTLVQSFIDMLDANDGKRVQLFFSNDSIVLEGKLMLFKLNKEQSVMYALQAANGRTTILSTAQLQQLKRVEFLETPNFTKQKERKIPTVRIDFKSSKPTQLFNFMYLQRNISWNPEYLIELLDDKKARLSLRATVSNEAEDFETDELNLVAGVPNFKYATQIHRFLSFIYPQAFADDLAFRGRPHPATLQQSLMSNSIQSFAYAEPAAPPMPELEIGEPETITANNADGTAIEDLYYYSLKNVNLKRGQRGLFDVFAVEIPVEHIYETTLNSNSAAYVANYVVEPYTHKVAHNIKIENTSNYTWTSGAAMVVRNDKGKFAAVSQDALHYTSIKDKQTVYLTEAPDVMVRASERELERKVDDKKVTRFGIAMFFDLVTVEGEIEINNFKGKDIRLDIKRLISGELLETSDKWQQVRRPVYQSSYTPNLVTNVCWELNLKAGEKKTVKYTYKMHVERYRQAVRN